MKMISTRGKDQKNIDDAIVQGLAADGGLFVPEQFPAFDIRSFYDEPTLQSFALRLLKPFFKDSKITIDLDFCHSVFNFEMSIKTLKNNRYALELFHGPTLSFKDFGARFFAACLESLGVPRKVLVATSGDTGSAVASALHLKKNIEAYILFPKDKVSIRQQQQMTCWGDNIHAFQVDGSFDDCQDMVKNAFANQSNDNYLTTANSINIARLLPQQLFYAYSSIQLSKKGNTLVDYIIPSGNLGNVSACYWAKKLGFPIGDIYIANNRNDVVTHYLNTGIYMPQKSIETLANAMDVGHPSNLERLIHFFGHFNDFKREVHAQSFSDEEIKQAITTCYAQEHYLICPHTATAYARSQTVNNQNPSVIVATAHPAKFEVVIEPLLKLKLPVPENLQYMLDKDQYYQRVRIGADILNM